MVARHEEKICVNPDCSRQYIPNSGNQKYCGLEICRKYRNNRIQTEWNKTATGRKCLWCKRSDSATIFVSGTASIDTEGRVVHVDDVQGQLRRALDNIEALLEGSGATLADVVSMVTYLKHARSLAAFRSVWAERGLPDQVPNTVTVADVCRPEWLCEIEAIAVCPEARP